MKIRNKLVCGKCTSCCQWGGDKNLAVKLVEEDLRLGIKGWVHEDGSIRMFSNNDTGDCTYLDRDRGCTIHNRRPKACKEFDCRELLDMLMNMPNNHMTRVIASAAVNENEFEHREDSLITLRWAYKKLSIESSISFEELMKLAKEELYG